MTIDPEELEPLIALLDDRDTVVTSLVDDRLRSYGPEVVRSLRNRSQHEPDAARQAAIVARAQALNTEFKLADLQEFIARPTGPLSLFEGSWILSSLFDYTLQRERYEDLFYRCSQEYLAENSDLRTGVENIRILNHIFFHRLKFTLYVGTDEGTELVGGDLAQALESGNLGLFAAFQDGVDTFFLGVATTESQR